jgi:hypothetical protein
MMRSLRTCVARSLALVAGGVCVAGAVSPVVAAPRELVIMVTGYWPPTNNMLRPWSPNNSQNGGTWTGQNWEGRGYTIKAYFPEFPGLTGPNWGKGTGDFEVDYQDTDADFARIVAELKPVAIVSFSRASTTIGWEMEPAYQRFRITSSETAPPGRTIGLYSTDYSGATRPTGTSIVGDAVGTVYPATLPMQAIVNGVQTLNTIGQPEIIDPFVASYNPATPNSYDYSGSFLSGFMPYLAARYRSLNSDPASPAYCAMSGHVHVGTSLVNSNALCVQASEITLREVISALNTALPIYVCQPADIAADTGEPLTQFNRGLTNNGVTEADYNAFFFGFFDALAYCDIADDAGQAPPLGTNNGVTEGDYNAFFSTYFDGCPV